MIEVFTSDGARVVTFDGSRIVLRSLFTNLAVAGLGAAGINIAAFWQANGTLNGTVNLEDVPGHPGAYDQGSIALDGAKKRIYITTHLSTAESGTHDGDACVRVFDETGSYVFTIFPDEVDPEANGIYTVYVPRPGRVWVGIESDPTGQILEYTSEGLFVRAMPLNAADSSQLIPAYGMGKYGDFAYFNVLRDSSHYATMGVWKYDTVNGGECEQVITVDSSIIGFVRKNFVLGMAMLRNGDILLTGKLDGTVAEGTAGRLNRYDKDGGLLQTIDSTQGEGIAADGTDSRRQHWWFARPDGVIDIARASATEDADQFSSEVDGDEMTSALASPHFYTLGDGPCSHHHHGGVVE